MAPKKKLTQAQIDKKLKIFMDKLVKGEIEVDTNTMRGGGTRQTWKDLVGR